MDEAASIQASKLSTARWKRSRTLLPKNKIPPRRPHTHRGERWPGSTSAGFFWSGRCAHMRHAAPAQSSGRGQNGAPRPRTSNDLRSAIAHSACRQHDLTVSYHSLLPSLLSVLFLPYPSPAQVAEPVAWRPEWQRFRPWEYAATAGLMATGFGSRFFGPGPPHEENTWGFEDDIADALALRGGAGGALRMAGDIGYAMEEHYLSDTLLAGALGFFAGYVVPSALHYGFGGDDAGASSSGLALPASPALRMTLLPFSQHSTFGFSAVGSF